MKYKYSFFLKIIYLFPLTSLIAKKFETTKKPVLNQKNSIKKTSKNLIPIIICLAAMIWISCSENSSKNSTNNESENAQGLSFTDSDLNENEIAGNLSIIKATDETNVVEYRLYWGSDSTTKLDSQPMIQSYTTTGSNITHIFAENSSVPSGATHFLVYSFTNESEALFPVSLHIPDKVYKLVKDINSGGDSSPGEMAVFSGKLYFSANDGTNGFELWEYDDNMPVNGTNPQMVSNISASGNSSPASFIVYNNILYFKAADDTSGQELWTYNGSSAPSKLFELYAAGNASPSNMKVFNNKLYFRATSDGANFELWEYNDQLAISGTNPQMLKDKHSITAVALASFLTLYNSSLFFQAFDPANGFELWSYDGTNAPALLNSYNISSGAGNAEPSYMTTLNSSLYFNASNGTDGKELWEYTGSGNPSQIRNANGGINNGGASNPAYLTVFNNKLYFNADGGDGTGKEIWVYDPSVTQSDTNPSRITDINTSGDSNPSNLIVYNNKLYFSATDGINGVELWEYDETNGATMVQNLDGGAGNSSPDNFVIYNNKIFMIADDGIDGKELWVFYINGSD